MRITWIIVMVAMLVLALENPALAARFGTAETIHHLQDLELKGPGGEELYLGYKTEVMNVGAGIYLRDDGYVLGIKGDSAHYFQMPDAAKVAQLQRAGLLPDPLPAYRLGAFDYLMGYSLWIILAIIILYYGIRGRFRARRRAAAMAASAAPGDGMSRSLEMGRKAD